MVGGGCVLTRRCCGFVVVVVVAVVTVSDGGCGDSGDSGWVTQSHSESLVMPVMVGKCDKMKINHKKS